MKEYLGDESRGPYRSTYCETYVIDRREPGAISIQVQFTAYKFCVSVFIPLLLMSEVWCVLHSVGSTCTGSSQDEECRFHFLYAKENIHCKI